MKCITSKVLLLGAQGVGKSSLALRLARQTFNATISPTIGASYFETHEEIGDHLIKLQLWDTAGQERFKAMIPMYYRNSAAALLVYDVTDKDSFRAVREWEEELRRHSNSSMVIYVIANKYDVPQCQRKVDKRVADAFANAIGGHFREISALTNQGIWEMKVDLCVKLIHNHQNCRIMDGQAANGHSLYDQVNLQQSTNDRPWCCS